ncbi:MAG: hypothetical protein JSS66_11000 [Armatimonadetes bacterium]|nr:hypothetical protein [Armatimonadota bacterium]
MCKPEVEETPGTDEQRATLHAEYRKTLWENQRYNLEQADKTIVTVASGVLAVSVTLLKDVQSSFAWVLVLAWFFFFAAILSVFLSYGYGNKSIDQKLTDAEDYFDKRNARAILRINKHEAKTKAWNAAGGWTFLIGLFLMVVFVGLSFVKGELKTRESGNNRGRNEDRQASITDPKSGSHTAEPGRERTAGAQDSGRTESQPTNPNATASAKGRKQVK